MQKRNLFHYSIKKMTVSHQVGQMPFVMFTLQIQDPPRLKDPKLQMMILKLYLRSILLIMNMIPESVFQYGNIQLTSKMRLEEPT